MESESAFVGLWLLTPFSTNYASSNSNLGPVSQVPKLFGLISGDIIIFVSAKRRRFEARNFAVVFIFNPFSTNEKSTFTE